MSNTPYNNISTLRLSRCFRTAVLAATVGHGCYTTSAIKINCGGAPDHGEGPRPTAPESNHGEGPRPTATHPLDAQTELT